jgi:hypothetical protein
VGWREAWPPRGRISSLVLALANRSSTVPIRMRPSRRPGHGLGTSFHQRSTPIVGAWASRDSPARGGRRHLEPGLGELAAGATSRLTAMLTGGRQRGSPALRGHLRASPAPWRGCSVVRPCLASTINPAGWSTEEQWVSHRSPRRRAVVRPPGMVGRRVPDGQVPMRLHPLLPSACSALPWAAPCCPAAQWCQPHDRVLLGADPALLCSTCCTVRGDLRP